MGIFTSDLENNKLITDYQLRITDYQLRIINYGLSITDYELRIINYGLRIKNYGLRIADYELRIINYGLRIKDCELRITDLCYSYAFTRAQLRFLTHFIEFTQLGNGGSMLTCNFTESVAFTNFVIFPFRNFGFVLFNLS